MQLFFVCTIVGMLVGFACAAINTTSFLIAGGIGFAVGFVVWFLIKCGFVSAADSFDFPDMDL